MDLHHRDTRMGEGPGHKNGKDKGKSAKDKGKGKGGKDGSK